MFFYIDVLLKDKQLNNKTTKQQNNTIDIALQKHSYYLVIA